MKRSYANTRKISLYVGLLSGFLGLILSAFTLLSSKYWVLSVGALLFGGLFCVDLLISARFLMVDTKKFSRIHLWLVTFWLALAATIFAHNCEIENVVSIAEMVADSLLILNGFVTILLLDDQKPVTFVLLALVPIVAQIVLRLFVGKWFVLLFVVFGILEGVWGIFSRRKNTYLHALLMTEGILWISFSLSAFFLNNYGDLFPVLRFLSFIQVFFISAFVLETPQNELPIMIPKSEEDYWAEKYSRMFSKKHSGLTENQVLDEPVSVLKSVSEDEANLLKEVFGIVTVRDLAENPYFNMSAEIVQEAKRKD